MHVAWSPPPQVRIWPLTCRGNVLYIYIYNQAYFVGLIFAASQLSVKTTNFKYQKFPAIQMHGYIDAYDIEMVMIN